LTRSASAQGQLEGRPEKDQRAHFLQFGEQKESKIHHF
jgi:hypothetical protein